MRPPVNRRALGLAAAAALVALMHPAAFAQQHTHVHGAAKLGVAVQDKTVSLQFEAPLDSLLGFEHRPKTAAQRAAAEALLVRLKAPAGLFGFDAAAGCSLAKSEVESAALAPAKAGVAAKTDEHADLDAAIEFSCSRPDLVTAIDIGLFQAFPRLRTLEVVVATARGQFKRSLKPSDRILRLTR